MIYIPWRLIALIISWIVVGVAVYEHCQTDANVKLAELQATLDAANKHNQEVQDERDKTIADISGRLADTQAKADKAAKDLRDHIASGAVRLSIPTTSCGPVSSDSSSASGNTETRAYIEPGVAESLVSIVQRGDQAINQLNACIAAYDSLRENQ